MPDSEQVRESEKYGIKGSRSRAAFMSGQKSEVQGESKAGHDKGVPSPARLSDSKDLPPQGLQERRHLQLGPKAPEDRLAADVQRQVILHRTSRFRLL
jgi:hypothetical protein